MRMQVMMLVSFWAGCGSIDAKQSDAGIPDESSMCDPTGTFDAPVPLSGFNTAGDEGAPRLSADELELYFSGRPVGMANYNLYTARRSSASQAFGTPTILPQANAAAGEYNPSVSSDGLMLLFDSSNISGEAAHLYVSTRTSKVGEFGTPSKVANVNSATVTDSDNQPFVTADGQELWFISYRAGGLGASDIYRAVWSGSSFANVAAITALSSSTTDWLPMLSADKLTVYLSSDRPGGKGGFDIWTAHRSTIRDGFPAPTPVHELNSSDDEFVGWLSPDNCRLYFSLRIAGAYDIHVATRHPL